MLILRKIQQRSQCLQLVQHPSVCVKGVTKEPQNINLKSIFRQNGIIPLATKLRTLYPNRPKLFIGNLDSFRVFLGVQLTLNGQPGFRRGVGNQVNNGFVAYEWPPAPVLSDVRKHSVLNGIPFAGTRRIMAYRDGEPGLISQFL